MSAGCRSDHSAKQPKPLHNPVPPGLAVQWIGERALGHPRPSRCASPQGPESCSSRFLCLVACKLLRCSTLWGWSAWFFRAWPQCAIRPLHAGGPLSPQWRQLDEVMVMCPQSALRRTNLARHSLAEDGRMEALTAALRLVIPGWLSFRSACAGCLF